jgi:nitroimidazol reductase NimA-like FMN-containing flavoprotein (pyridoxamine 5'-phosphate oxidase superfamily)
MQVKLSGPWSLKRVQDHLDTARIPIRLACVNALGFPIVASLWYVHREGALWCATQSKAALARFLETNPRCGFEVSGDTPPYRGVRGWGKAGIFPEKGEEVLRDLIARYLEDDSVPVARWLLSRVESEVAIRIQPERLVSWNYGERMKGIP